MELVEVRMPMDQMEGSEAVVAVWLKQIGEAVEIHQPLLEIATDKATSEIAAPAAGTLKSIAKSAGEPVKGGDLLGEIETALEGPKTLRDESCGVTSAE